MASVLYKSITCATYADFVLFFSSKLSTKITICVSLGAMKPLWLQYVKRWRRVKSTHGHVTCRIESSYFHSASCSVWRGNWLDLPCSMLLEQSDQLLWGTTLPSNINQWYTYRYTLIWWTPAMTQTWLHLKYRDYQTTFQRETNIIDTNWAGSSYIICTLQKDWLYLRTMTYIWG